MMQNVWTSQFTNYLLFTDQNDGKSYQTQPVHGVKVAIGSVQGQKACMKSDHIPAVDRAQDNSC